MPVFFFLFSQSLMGQLASPPEWFDYHKGMLDLFDDSSFFEKVNGGIARFRGLGRDQEGFQFYVEDSYFAYSLSAYKDYPKEYSSNNTEDTYWKIAMKKVRMRRSAADKLEELLGYRGEALVVFISSATSLEVERRVLDLIAKLNSLNETITDPVKIDGLKDADPIAVSRMRIMISRGSGDKKQQIMCDYDCPYIPNPLYRPKPSDRPSPFGVYEATLYELFELAKLGESQ